MDLASLWPLVNDGDDLVSHGKDWEQQSRERRALDVKHCP